MSNFASISVAESSVYRGIYNELRQSSFQPFPDQFASDYHGRFVDMNRWTFLEKLLAIEKAHDRKALARKILKTDRECPNNIHDRERSVTEQDRQSPESTQNRERPMNKQDQECPVDKHNTSNKTVVTDVPDLLSRWLHDQVLDDNSDEPLRSDDRINNHLPAITNISHPGTYGSHPLRQTSSRMSSSILETSDDTRSVHHDNRHLAAMDDRTTQSSRMSRDASTPDVDVIKSNRKRQLRLPPILLPPVYTVTPRPLQYREFLTPTKIRGPITDEEWEDLKDCRYIRHAIPRYSLQMATSNLSTLQY